MTARVFVTGATGVLGRAAVPALVAAGHDVTGVARTDDAAARLRAVGAVPVTVDLFDAAAVRDAVAGHDALIHLATSIPPMHQMHRAGAWELNDRLRVEATCALLDAARAHGITRVVKESVTFTYLDGGNQWLDERAPVDRGETWRPTLEGERLVDTFTAEGGQGVVLRFGLMYAADARFARELRRLARLRINPLPGRPEGFVSSIHADDAGRAIVAALAVAPGTYNVVDDVPLRREAYAAAVARAFAAGRLHRLPEAPLRRWGGDGVRALGASQRVSNRAFVTASGWSPRWPDAAQGWAALFADRAEVGSARSA